MYICLVLVPASGRPSEAEPGAAEDRRGVGAGRPEGGADRERSGLVPGWSKKAGAEGKKRRKTELRNK